jgi:hypothetical protein
LASQLVVYSMMDNSMTGTISISASFDREFSSFDRWTKIIRFFSFRRLIFRYAEILYRAIIKKITAELDDSILLLSGAITEIKNYDRTVALKELNDVNEIINKFSKIEAKFSKYEYLGSEEVRIKILKCLTYLYDIELLLRKKAFENKPLIKSNPDFIRELSDKSKLAIANSI